MNTPHPCPTLLPDEMPPLPKEWHGLYQSYKTDTKTYLDALKAIRGVLQTCDDSSDACDDIEEIIKGVFE